MLSLSGQPIVFLGLILIGLLVGLAPELLFVVGAAGMVAIGLAAPGVSIIVLSAARPILDQNFLLGRSFTVLGLSLSELLGGAIILFSAGVLITRLRLVRGRKWLHEWWLVLAWFVLTMLWSPNVPFALALVVRIASWVVLLSAIMSLDEGDRLRTWFPRAATLAVIVGALGVVLAMIRGIGTGYYGVGELFGGYYSPQGVAFPMVVLFPYVLVGVGRGGRWGRLAMFALMMSGLGVLLSFVRAAWIAVAVVLAFMLLANRSMRGQRRRIAFAVAVLLVVAGLAAASQWGAVQERIQDLIPTASSAEAIGSGRGEIYAVLLSEIGRSSVPQLLFGHGLGFSEIVTERTLGYVRVAHSDPLWVLLETGLVGLGLCAFAAVRLGVLLAHDKTAPDAALRTAALASSVGLLVLSLVNGVLADGPTMFQFFAGVGCALGVGLFTGGSDVR